MDLCTVAISYQRCMKGLQTFYDDCVAAQADDVWKEAVNSAGLPRIALSLSCKRAHTNSWALQRGEVNKLCRSLAPLKLPTAGCGAC
jgi:hypothetical protein